MLEPRNRQERSNFAQTRSRSRREDFSSVRDPARRYQDQYTPPKMILVKSQELCVPVEILGP